MEKMVSMCSLGYRGQSGRFSPDASCSINLKRENGLQVIFILDDPNLFDGDSPLIRSGGWDRGENLLAVL